MGLGGVAGLTALAMDKEKTPNGRPIQEKQKTG